MDVAEPQPRRAVLRIERGCGEGLRLKMGRRMYVFIYVRVTVNLSVRTYRM